MSEWISVEDRLPEVMSRFIGCNSEGAVYQCAMMAGGGIVPIFILGRDGPEAEPVNNVTHWMPLPEPPEL